MEGTFGPVFGVTLAICLGIAFLGIFFKVLGAISARKRPNQLTPMNQLLQSDRLVNVHLLSGKVISQVYVDGFTDWNHSETGIPFDFRGMLVVHRPSGARLYIPVKSVRMVEELDAPTAT